MKALVGKEGWITVLFLVLGMLLVSRVSSVSIESFEVESEDENIYTVYALISSPLNNNVNNNITNDNNSSTTFTTSTIPTSPSISESITTSISISPSSGSSISNSLSTSTSTTISPSVSNSASRTSIITASNSNRPSSAASLSTSISTSTTQTSTSTPTITVTTSPTATGTTSPTSTGSTSSTTTPTSSANPSSAALRRRQVTSTTNNNVNCTFSGSITNYGSVNASYEYTSASPLSLCANYMSFVQCNLNTLNFTSQNLSATIEFQGSGRFNSTIYCVDDQNLNATNVNPVGVYARSILFNFGNYTEEEYVYVAEGHRYVGAEIWLIVLGISFPIIMCLFVFIMLGITTIMRLRRPVPV